MGATSSNIQANRIKSLQIYVSEQRLMFVRVMQFWLLCKRRPKAKRKTRNEKQHKTQIQPKKDGLKAKEMQKQKTLTKYVCQFVGNALSLSLSLLPTQNNNKKLKNRFETWLV